MTDKKIITNVIYAICLFGVISATVGFYSELLNIIQLWGVRVYNLTDFVEENFWLRILLYAFCAMISSVTLAAMLVKIFSRSDILTVALTAVSVIGGVTIVCVSIISYWVLWGKYESFSDEISSLHHSIGYARYIDLTAIRSGAWSMALATVITAICDITGIVIKRKNKKAEV